MDGQGLGAPLLHGASDQAERAVSAEQSIIDLGIRLDRYCSEQASRPSGGRSLRAHSSDPQVPSAEEQLGRKTSDPFGEFRVGPELHRPDHFRRRYLGAAPHCRDAFLDFVLDVAFDVREHYERVQRPSLAPQRAGPAPAPAGWGPAGEPEPLDAAQSSPGPPAPRHLSSDVATVLVILKSFVGGTLLVVPREFLRAGVLSGTVLFWAVGLLELWCMLKLLQAHQQRGGSLGTLARLALGAAGAAAVECSVVLSQLGFAAAEMIYVARNGASALEWLSENSPAASAWLGEVDVAGMTATLTWLQLLFIVPASWYRELSAFTVYNFVGNVLVLGTVVFLSSITVTGLAREGMSQDWELGCPTKQALVFLGFSTYAFEGINMVIPMYRVHRDKNTFAGLLVATIVGIIMLFSVFACSNVFLYGQSVKPILTLNLPQKSAAAGLVPLAFSLASLVLVPLMVFPTFEILEGAARRGCGALLVGSPARVNALRGAVVLLCAVVAREGGAYLDVFLSLVGAVGCVPLAFVYPALIHYRLVAQSRLGAAGDLACLAVGLGIMAVCVEAVVTT